MNILSVIDCIKQLTGESEVGLTIELHNEYNSNPKYGGISEHTTLSSLRFGHATRAGQFILKVSLTHKCHIGGFSRKLIRQAPYYCKSCAQCILTAEQGEGMALKVNRSIVPKMQISLASTEFFRDKKLDFDMGDLLLIRHEGLVHKCPAMDVSLMIQANVRVQVSPSGPRLASKLAFPSTTSGSTAYHYLQGKQTVTGFPFKCGKCKKKIGEEGLTFQKLVALAAIIKG